MSTSKKRRGPDKEYSKRYKALLKSGDMTYFGSRLEVLHKKALYTKSYMTFNDLMVNKNGHIVSKRASQRFKKLDKPLLN